ncbi:SRPBCC family protein [Hypericibacter sp.]|uniref:SRPBCC family protein n=1 Tax=Hypericibacter sp. TaxID=2705401 RepID=UPI003D6C747A
MDGAFADPQSVLLAGAAPEEGPPEMRWPAGFSPGQTDLYARNEVFIDATGTTVWWHLVAAQKWPSWYPNSHELRIAGDRTGMLQPDSRFEFFTFGLHIDARMAEFAPESRLGWFGKGDGLEAFHRWRLVRVPKGCQVVTEWTAKGPRAMAMGKRDPDAIRKGHDLWLRNLKTISET